MFTCCRTALVVPVSNKAVRHLFNPNSVLSSFHCRLANVVAIILYGFEMVIGTASQQNHVRRILTYGSKLRMGIGHMCTRQGDNLQPIIW